ncbi:hypothetical protein T02_11684 [Trichinella nativa]|uniref:Uncharacterized protein n=1 Tax=Trichinella nativa TaxID=6335 RepID=A0A0V1LQB5_9BILA|nr:hypothetical protein T02_11684 [Trichinella nativa]
MYMKDGKINLNYEFLKIKLHSLHTDFQPSHGCDEKQELSYYDSSVDNILIVMNLKFQPELKIDIMKKMIVEVEW